jgi:hypothetical protein
MSEKGTIEVGSTVRLKLEENGWKLDVAHSPQGFSGRHATFKTLEEAVEWINSTYDWKKG